MLIKFILGVLLHHGKPNDNTTTGTAGTTITNANHRLNYQDQTTAPMMYSLSFFILCTNEDFINRLELPIPRDTTIQSTKKDLRDGGRLLEVFVFLFFSLYYYYY